MFAWKACSRWSAPAASIPGGVRLAKSGPEQVSFRSIRDWYFAAFVLSEKSKPPCLPRSNATAAKALRITSASTRPRSPLSRGRSDVALRSVRVLPQYLGELRGDRDRCRRVRVHANRLGSDRNIAAGYGGDDAIAYDPKHAGGRMRRVDGIVHPAQNEIAIPVIRKV